MSLIKIILFSILSLKSESARILAIFPTPSISHQVIFRPLTQELAKRGHEVVVITTDPAFPKGKTPQNLYEIDCHDLSYEMWKDVKLTSTGKKQDIYKQVSSVFEILPKVIMQQFLSEEVQKFVNNKNITFDLLIVEVISRAALGYSHVYKVPVIHISSLSGTSDTFEMMGAPIQPNLYPTPSRQRSYNITLWQNIFELYTQLSLKRMFNNAKIVDNEILQGTIDQTIPSVEDLKNNVYIVFLNVHPLWDSNRPVSKNIISLYGLHPYPKKDIPRDLKLYLDESEKGIVYVSFGTNALPSSLPPEKIKIITNVLSTLQYKVLMKWDKEELPGCSKNVKLGKWFPQADLLRHPNIKAFVTQGGVQSTEEAIDAGVPLVGLPLGADQWYNSERYEFYKIGINLDMETLTEDNFRNAIETVIHNTSYRQNVRKLRSLMRDEAYTPLQRAVWWTEHVLRHGRAHLRAPAANMHWTQYYELDLILIVLCFLTGSLIVLGYLLYVVSCKILTSILSIRSKCD